MLGALRTIDQSPQVLETGLSNESGVFAAARKAAMQPAQPALYVGESRWTAPDPNIGTGTAVAAVGPGAGDRNVGNPTELERAEEYLEELDAFGGFGEPIPSAPPTVNDGAHRVAYIWENQPAVFEVKEDPSAYGGPVEKEAPWRGGSAVYENNMDIEAAAKKYKLKPDLIRAIMWTEGALGHKGGFNYLADMLRLSGSVLPMNIQPDKWARLIGERPADLYDPKKNIETGAALLAQITRRIPDSTPEKIGSVWNYSGRENVNDFGAYVKRIYDDKPWLTWEPSDPSLGPDTYP